MEPEAYVNKGGDSTIKSIKTLYVTLCMYR